MLDGLLRGILTHAVALSPPPHIQVSLLRILTHVDSEVRLTNDTFTTTHYCIDAFLEDKKLANIKKLFVMYDNRFVHSQNCEMSSSLTCKLFGMNNNVQEDLLIKPYWHMVVQNDVI